MGPTGAWTGPRFAAPPARSDHQGATLSSFSAEAAAGLPGPAWLQDRRALAAGRFGDLELPTSAEEVWRYSRIDDFDLDAYHPVAEPGRVAGGTSALADAAGAAAATVTVADGFVITAEVDAAVARKGVRIGPVSALDDGDALLGCVTARSDAFTELHDAFLPDAVVVDVPAGVAVEAPVVVVHTVSGGGAAAFPRTIVRAGEASQVTVVEIVVSNAGPALIAPVVELDVAAAANVRYCNVQRLGREAWQIGYQVSRVGQEATLQSATIALGGDYARLRTDSHLVGDGATSNLLAVYFGDGEQMHDFRTMQAHEAPKTTSDLLFKGAVTGTAHAVYTGLIKVARGAAGTNAFQTNRNLVLSEGARADSVPNLEIEENDVRCSHASAVGPIDEEQRYYLESRGVPPQVAERLIVLGFFDEVLQRLPSPSLAARLRDQLAALVGGRV